MAALRLAVCLTFLGVFTAPALMAQDETGPGRRCLVQNHVCSTASACTDPEPDPPVTVLLWKSGDLVLTNQAGHKTHFQPTGSDAAARHYASAAEVTPSLRIYRFLTLDRNGNLALSTHEISNETNLMVKATVLTAYCGGEEN